MIIDRLPKNGPWLTDPPPEFLAATWRAGIVRYDVDFTARRVAYYGSSDEEYVEDYPAVQVD